MIRTHDPQSTPCISRTSLKWTAEGELARDDLQQVLARLAAVDAYGPELRSRGLLLSEQDSC